MQAQKILVDDLVAYFSEVCELVGEKLPVQVFMHKQGQIEISGTRAGKSYQQMIPDGDETQHVAVSASFTSRDILRAIRRVMSRNKSEICEIKMSRTNGNLKFGYVDSKTELLVWVDAMPIPDSAHAFLATNDGPLCRVLKGQGKSAGWYAKYLSGMGW